MSFQLKSIFLLAVLIVPTNSTTISRNSICTNLDKLEGFMTDEMDYEDSTFQCTCSSPQNDTYLEVHCKSEYIMEDGDGPAPGRHTMYEKLIFHSAQSNGQYDIHPHKMSWGDTAYRADGHQEEFSFVDGKLDSCEANGCGDCSICEDSRYMQVDCRALSRNDMEYEHSCNDEVEPMLFSLHFNYAELSGNASAPNNKIRGSNKTSSIPKNVILLGSIISTIAFTILDIISF